MSHQQDQFLKAFENNVESLFRHGFFRVGDKELAQDLVQDTFTKTWDYMVKGNRVDDFKPFLFRTLNNLIIDEYRKKKTESLDALFERDVPVGVFEELKSGGLEELSLELDAQGLHAILAQMPEQYRVVVVMRYIDGLSPQEISKVLGENVNVISVRIHRGIAWLKKQVTLKT